MGRILNGANGGFSGKAGSVIGSRWRDIYYIKGLSGKKPKPRSTKQLEQQTRFALAVGFLNPIKPFVNLGFNDLKQTRSTGYNIAIRHFLQHAIIGQYPDLQIDYPSVVISKGTISAAASPKLSQTGRKLIFTWDNEVSPVNGYPDDEAQFCVYDPQIKDFYLGAEVSLRSSGSAQVTIPEDVAGRTFQGYLFFVRRDGKQWSNSGYAGAVVVE